MDTSVQEAVAQAKDAAAPVTPGRAPPAATAAAATLAAAALAACGGGGASSGDTGTGGGDTATAPSEADASRFLAQASMGASRAEIASVQSLGYAGWIGCEYRPAGSTSAGLGWLKRRS